MSQLKVELWIVVAGLATSLCVSLPAAAEQQSEQQETAQLKIVPAKPGQATITATITMSKDGKIEVQTQEVAEKECADGKCKACEDGTCKDANCANKQATKATAVAVAAAETAEEDLSSAGSEAELGTPTHRQSKIIKANQDDLEKTKLNCFCMTLDGRILGGCGTSKDNGEIRVFDPNGNYLESWKTPVKVEAINVRAGDGRVFVAGNGKLVQLNDSGEVLLTKDSPHVSISKEQAAKMRQVVVDQYKNRVKMFRNQAKVYDQQIETYTAKLEDLKTKLAELPEVATTEDDEEEGDDDAEEDDASKARKMLAQQVKQNERVLESLSRTRELWDKRIEQLGDSEPSDEEIDKQLESQIARKMAVASISAVDDKVYLACSEAVGYGYCVWKVSEDFESGEEVVGNLSGCCGQMDVQANAKGIYVAENSRDRVICFDHDGEEITHWGHSARSGIRGFGSCCNPMNVAFGPENTVYTAESGTGRIKQYSHKGELLQVVGSADLVPGCKKVSIGVSEDGNRVFMLDITRDHIVMMDRIPGEERSEMVAAAKAKEEAANETDEAAQTQAKASSVQNILGALMHVQSTEAVKIQRKAIKITRPNAEQAETPINDLVVDED